MVSIGHYYENPHILHVGTVAPHAHFVPFATEEQALCTPQWELQKSSRILMLSGCEWPFAYYEQLAQVPEDFFAPQFNAEHFQSIPVPGCWQMHGFDRNQYSNVRYPFPFDPPYVPAQNPCGAYRRVFELTPEQCTQNITLHFGGVDSCCYVWVNGTLAGYDQVSHSPTEFDVTDLVHPGKNTLAVLVLKWCDGSYLEDQDKLRMTGIFREVYLMFRPHERITDFFVHTVLSSDFKTAQIEVDCTAEKMPAMNCTLRAPSGEVLAQQPLHHKMCFSVENPVLWNAEAPALYTLTFVGDEAFSQDIGLRSVYVQNGVLYLNGQNIKLKGVNRHDSDPYTGYVISPVQMQKDLLMMKQSNLNAIRTSHYPNADWAPQMFGRIGLYTIAEADMESHGCTQLYGANDKKDYFTLINSNEYYGLVASDPQFHDAIVDRTQRNVERDKNASAVLIWSLGNESAYGPSFEAAAAFAKQRDPARLVHYENSIYQMKNHVNDLSNLDLFSQMYAPVEAIDAYFSNKMLTVPFIQCEMTHAMGNGPGDLEDYYERIYRYDGFAGGFVWEWCDHAVWQGKSENGTDRFLYGGDFGEYPHDGDFCIDGLVYPDRRPHTGLMELKNVARPARVVAQTPEGKITIYNTLDFTVLSDAVSAVYTVYENGKAVAQGEISPQSLQIAPHQTACVQLPQLPRSANGSVLVRWRQKNDTAYQPADTQVGFDQVLLQTAPLPLQPHASFDALTVSETQCEVRVQAAGLCYIFNKTTGLFDTIVRNNTTFLALPMQWNLWRAPVGNDVVIRNEWEAAGYNRGIPRVYHVAVHADAQQVRIEADMSIAAVSLQRIVTLHAQWTVHSDGRLMLHTEVERTPGMPYLPRFGLRMALPQRFASVEYLGYGPQESYCDKHQACWHGHFSTTVKAMHEDYIHPQENGARFGCQRLCVAQPNAALLAAGKSFSFNASVYTQEELANKKHNFELVPSGYTILCLDYKQSGMGSNSCGPELAQRWRLEETEFTWEIELDFTTDFGE